MNDKRYVALFSLVMSYGTGFLSVHAKSPWLAGMLIVMAVCLLAIAMVSHYTRNL